MRLPVWQGRSTPLQMGLKSCAAKEWVNSADLFDTKNRISSQLALKSGLLETNLAEIFAAEPESLGACKVLASLISEACHTQINEGEHPLLAAGRLVADDLLLLSNKQGHGDWILKAALLAFPSHWKLSDKFGKSMDAIHAPVPAYADKLHKPVSRFFDMMQADTISYRVNWTLQVGDALFTPQPSQDEILSPEDIPASLFVRSERQTFRKILVQNASSEKKMDESWVVFGIGTHIAPVGLWAEDFDALKALQKAVSILSPEMKQYRGVGRYEEAFHKWADSLSS